MDANAHASWDREVDNDAVGDDIEDWMVDAGYICANDGEVTRISSQGNPSTPDITLHHASWATRVTWQVAETLGSDHLPG